MWSLLAGPSVPKNLAVNTSADCQLSVIVLGYHDHLEEKLVVNCSVPVALPSEKE